MKLTPKKCHSTGVPGLICSCFFGQMDELESLCPYHFLLCDCISWLVSGNSLYLIRKIIITAGRDIDIQPHQDGLAHPALTVGPSHIVESCLE